MTEKTFTKMVKLHELTRILLNKCRAKIITENPKSTKTTDDIVIRKALKTYLEDEKCKTNKKKR